jgi:hypothetical protein
MTGRRGLDLSAFAQPAQPEAQPHAEAPDAQPAEPPPARATLDRRAIDEVSEFRRRDPADELTITVRGPSATIKAFKRLCRAERRPQAEMLRRMLDVYGEPKP